MTETFDFSWPSPPNIEIWHTKNDFSQIATAIEHVEKIVKEKNIINHIVRIAHFDTGYDPNHSLLNHNIFRKDLEKNFFDKQVSSDSAIDLGTGPNSGHGTGTLSILAGKSFGERAHGISDGLQIEIVPIRVTNNVVLYKNKSFENALEYVINLYENPDTRCHIITMSLGGSCSKKWPKLINQAYEKGILIVAAGGNNFGKSTPRTLVYPARFNRVIAVVGTCFNYTPYFNKKNNGNLKEMQGNYGPRKLMRTAIAAFTPNIPWAVYGKKDEIRFNGAGTSSATPQVAIAVALYYQKFFEEIESQKIGWEKIEIIKKALFSTALKKINREEKDDINLFFGNGVIQAFEMLNFSPNFENLKMEEEDDSFLPSINLLSEIFLSESNVELDEDTKLELSSLFLENIKIQKLLEFEELENIRDVNSFNKLLEIKNIILKIPNISNKLRIFLERN